MNDKYQIKELFPLAFEKDRLQLTSFLNGFGLNYETDIEYACACACADHRENMVACGCCAGSVLKCFAIEE